MTLEQFCEQMTDILERYNANMLALIEEVCATSPLPPSSSLPASISTSPPAPEWLTALYKQVDEAGVDAFEREL